MITRVRVAPVERWCQPMLALLQKAKNDDVEPSSGLLVAIETSSIRIGRMCGGREWRLVVGFCDDIIVSDVETAENIHPGETTNVWGCEHMLEVD
jgi:hypothetical protein